MFDEDITLHLQSKWTFLKHLLGAMRIDRYFWNSNRRCVAKDVVSKDFIRKYWYGIAIALEEFFSLIINTFSHGYHEYMSVWMPHIGDDSLFCRRELSNEYDKYAAAIVAIDHFKRCWACASFPKQDVKQVPSLTRIVCKLQSYRNKNKQRDWCRIGYTDWNNFCWQKNGDWMA